MRVGTPLHAGDWQSFVAHGDFFKIAARPSSLLSATQVRLTGLGESGALYRLSPRRLYALQIVSRSRRYTKGFSRSRRYTIEEPSIYARWPFFCALFWRELGILIAPWGGVGKALSPAHPNRGVQHLQSIARRGPSRGLWRVTVWPVEGVLHAHWPRSAGRRVMQK